MAKVIKATVTADTKQFNEKIDGVTKKSRDLGKSLKTVAKGSAMAFAGVGAIVGKTVMEFAAFEKQMSAVKAVSGATTSDFKKMTDQARELGGTTAFTAKQAGEGMEFLARAGFKTNQIIGAMPGLLNLAASSGLELGQASSIVADNLKAFGLEADQAGHLSDVLAKTSASTNTNVQELGEAFKYVAPIAKGFGMSAEETSAALGIMANSGIKASMAGTSLRTALTQLAAPNSAVTTQLKDMGIAVEGFKGKIRPFNDIMDDLRIKLTGASQAQRTQTIKTLFGQRAIASMSSILDVSTDKFGAFTTSLIKSDGAAKRMADTMLDNVAGSFTIFKSALSEAQIGIGEKLAPAIRSLIDLGTSLLTKFNGLSEGTKGTIATFLKFGLIITGLLTLMGTVGLAVLAVGKGLTALGIGARFAAVGVRALMGATGISLLIVAMPIVIKYARVFAEKLEEWKKKFPAIGVAIDYVLKPLRALLIGIDKVVGAGKRLFAFFGKSQPAVSELDNLKKKLDELNTIASEGGEKAAKATEEQRIALQKQIDAIEQNTSALEKRKGMMEESKDAAASIDDMTAKIKANEEALKTATEEERKFLEASNAGLSANIEKLEERRKSLSSQVLGEITAGDVPEGAETPEAEAEKAALEDNTAELQAAADAEVAITAKKEEDKSKIEAQAREKKLRDAQANLEILRAQAEGASKQEIEFLQKDLELKNAMKEAELIKDDELRAIEIEKVKLQQEELQNTRDEASARKQEIDAEIRAIEDEQRIEFNDLDKEALEEKLLSEEEMRKQYADQKAGAQQNERTKFYQEEQKHGKIVATLNRILRNENVKGFGSAMGQLTQLQQSEHSKQKQIGKVAAAAQAAISTAEGAIKVYTSLAGIPIIGQPLGIAAAAALTAYGMERQAKIKSAQSGGIVPRVSGSITGSDGVPILAAPGEAIMTEPITKTFEQQFPDFRSSFANAGEVGKVLQAMAGAEGSGGVGGDTTNNIVNIDFASSNLVDNDTFVTQLVGEIKEQVLYDNADIGVQDNG